VKIQVGPNILVYLNYYYTELKILHIVQCRRYIWGNSGNCLCKICRYQ